MSGEHFLSGPRNRKILQPRRPAIAVNENARCGTAGVLSLGGSAWEEAENFELTRRSFAGDAMDVRTVDAEVMQFAVGHAAEFGDRLTILAPVVERASDVHVKPLSEGLICQQPPIGADLYLMTGIYVAVRRRKTAKISGHLCDICNALHNLTAVWPANRQSDLREYSAFEAARVAMRK